MLRQSALFLAICLTGALTTAQAQIYKWTDAQGTVHYSQTKPHNKNVQVFDSRIRKPSNYKSNTNNQSVQAEKKPLNKADEARKKRIRELEKNVKRQNEMAKKNRCQTLQQNMSALQKGGRIKEGNDYLTGEQIDSKRISVKAQYSRDCS